MIHNSDACLESVSRLAFLRDGGNRIIKNDFIIIQLHFLHSFRRLEWLRCELRYHAAHIDESWRGN